MYNIHLYTVYLQAKKAEKVLLCVASGGSKYLFQIWASPSKVTKSFDICPT